MTSHLLKTLREVLMDAVHVSFDFFKVLIPISIAMKILAELDWIRYLAGGISAAAGLAAGISASAKLGRARLPAAVGAAGCYLLLTLVLRGVVFGTLGQMPWATAAAVMAGAFAAAIMQSGKKKRRSGRR